MTVAHVTVEELSSFDPVVYYNEAYLVLIGIVAFIVQLLLLHTLRYHKTIAVVGATLSADTLQHSA